jgi:hypothetical protein
LAIPLTISSPFRRVPITFGKATLTETSRISAVRGAAI